MNQTEILIAPKTDAITSSDVIGKPSVGGASIFKTMKKFVYPGQKIHFLTVIKEVTTKDHSGQKVRSVLCKCDCGNTTTVRVSDVFKKKHPTTACGCQKNKIKHGQTKTKLYGVWNEMKRRTNNPNNPFYYNYGGRGISLCLEWYDFKTFFEWSKENGYKEGLMIERINNDGNYEPSNCRWATRTEQNNNKHSNHTIQIGDERLSMSMFCKKYNISYQKFKDRLYRGWTMEKAMINCLSHTPRGTVNFFGVCMDGKRFMAKIDINHKTKFLGRYNTAKEAALAYDKAARKYRGESTYLNFK